MTKNGWRDGNRITLLENGEAFFPAVFSAMEKARSSIILETFIWFEDDTGWQLRNLLLKAARRGVKIECLMDGYGTPPFSEAFAAELATAGVALRFYDPRPLMFGMRTNVFRRMHRKIVVVDEAIAFVGGINYCDDHLRSFGPEAKQDYSLQLEGPVVQDISDYAKSVLPQRDTPQRWWARRYHRIQDTPHVGEAQALFVWRDNGEHRDDIERHYLKMLANAKHDVVIANAYFFPGYRLLHAMRSTARRGVRVRLVVQGKPDMPIVKTGAHLLYHYLLKGGVDIYEYQPRPLHGKVAIMDDCWATVGSSNLDPLSLALNLEANVIIHDRTFTQQLRDNLGALINLDCRQVEEASLPRRTWWEVGVSVLAFHFLRHFPAMVGWFPAHTAHITEVAPTKQPVLETVDNVREPEVKP